MAAVIPIARAPQNVRRAAPILRFAPPKPAALAPKRASDTSEAPATTGIAIDTGLKTYARSGNAAPTVKETHETRAATIGFGAMNVRKPQFISRMCPDRIVFHQLNGDPIGQIQIQPPPDINSRKFPVLGIGIGSEFLRLAIEIGLFAVGLRTDRDVFARGHRHRTGREARDSGHHHSGRRSVSRCYTDHKTRDRHDAIVRAQDRRTQPTDAFAIVSFWMVSKHSCNPSMAQNTSDIRTVP